MAKPLSGAIAHKTSIEDIELIARMAKRYTDDEIARVLSKLGRKAGKGNRWRSQFLYTIECEIHAKINSS